MEDPKKPETIADEDLTDVQGGSVFGTPSSGWGIKRPTGTEAEVRDRDERGFNSTAGGSPNV